MTVIQPNGFFGWTCARCGMFVAGDGPHYCGVLPASPHSRLVTATATALVNLIAEKDARIAELETELAKFEPCHKWHYRPDTCTESIAEGDVVGTTSWPDPIYHKRGGKWPVNT